MIESVFLDAGKGINSLKNNTLPKPGKEQSIPHTIIKKALKPDAIERLYKPIAKEVERIPRPVKANSNSTMNIAAIAQ